VLEALIRDDDVEESSLPTDRISEAGDLDGVWEQLRSLHLLVDERREQGRISLERAKELRSRLLELSRRLATEAVEEEAHTYQQLLRDVSHDIRSPLHSIIFLAEALYSGRGSSVEEAEKRQLGTIYAAGTSLLNLVNDLLDYARMAAGGNGGVAEDPFTLESVVADVRHLLGPLVQHHGTDFSVEADGGGRFVGDRQLVCRVLTNLVSNAIEAAGRDGTVRVHLDGEGGGLRIDVLDDGDEGDIEQIECLLARPEEESLAGCVGEKRQGRTHGLGLLICGRLVSVAGGWAEAGREDANTLGREDAAGAATRVTVWLPFPREADAA
jgi:two-component system sensor histidine kinase ChiS